MSGDPAAHLLVVDDDERIRGLLQKFLMRGGFLVSVARDAAQARRLLAGLEFDLIVLDVMMPGEDGIALTRDLRRHMTTPILLLTAKGETGNRIEGLEAGADDYLVKPFEPKELLLRINAILRRVPQVRAAEAVNLDGFGAYGGDVPSGFVAELCDGDVDDGFVVGRTREGLEVFRVNEIVGHVSPSLVRLFYLVRVSTAVPSSTVASTAGSVGGDAAVVPAVLTRYLLPPANASSVFRV